MPAQEPGKEEYTDLEMKKSPKGWWVGKVPKKAVTGKSVKYYFEGRNAAGKAVVRNGEVRTAAHIDESWIGVQAATLLSQATANPTDAMLTPVLGKP